MGSRVHAHCGTDPRGVSGSVYFTQLCPRSVTTGFLVVGPILSTVKHACKIKSHVYSRELALAVGLAENSKHDNQ